MKNKERQHKGKRLQALEPREVVNHPSLPW